jgi:hypothetical protein
VQLILLASNCIWNIVVNDSVCMHETVNFDLSEVSLNQFLLESTIHSVFNWTSLFSILIHPGPDSQNVRRLSQRGV